MRGTPYIMRRRLIMGPAGLPCTPPPFGSLVAVNLNTGGIAWNVPLGTMGDTPGARLAEPGRADRHRQRLVFIGATLEHTIRAFDVETAVSLESDAPAGARATPMTYEAERPAVVVIAAAGRTLSVRATPIVAFALPAR